MNKSELLINNAPKSGIYLIYTRKEVLCGKYHDINFIDSYINGEILEIHLFDSNAEYRLINSRTKGTIETVIKDDGKDFISETLYLEDRFGEQIGNNCIKLVSYIEYDEDKGMGRISGYRLQEVK